MKKNYLIAILGFFGTSLIACSCILAESRFVVVITSCNNALWYKKNLGSVFSQTYKKYRVIYIDDCSMDGTPELVEEYIKLRKQEHRVTLIKNTIWQSQVANHYKAAHLCKDDEIIVNLDGDDWFLDFHVLNHLNSVYSNPDVWLTYGQYKMWPRYRMGHARRITKEDIEANGFRDTPWLYTHLRTFYAGLIKKIKLQDLLMMGTFKIMSPTPDLALMYPMLEMAGYHVRFISKILYVYNKKNMLSQHFTYQTILEKQIRQWPRYQPISDYKCPETLVASEMPIPIIIQNYTDESSLRAFIVSCQDNIKDLSTIYVVYDPHTHSVTETIKNNFADVIWITFDEISALMQQLNAEFILYATVDTPITQTIDILECIQRMRQTDAYAFYFGVNHDTMKVNERASHLFGSLNDSIGFWHDDFVSYVWYEPTNILEFKQWLQDYCKPEGFGLEQAPISFSNSMILYRSDEFQKRIIEKSFDGSARKLALFYRK